MLYRNARSVLNRHQRKRHRRRSCVSRFVPVWPEGFPPQKKPCSVRFITDTFEYSRFHLRPVGPRRHQFLRQRRWDGRYFADRFQGIGIQIPDSRPFPDVVEALFEAALFVNRDCSEPDFRRYGASPAESPSVVPVAGLVNLLR